MGKATNFKFCKHIQREGYEVGHMRNYTNVICRACSACGCYEERIVLGCPTFPTYVILIHQRFRQTDGRTTCNLNTALCTIMHRVRVVKVQKIYARKCIIFIFINASKTLGDRAPPRPAEGAYSAHQTVRPPKRPL